LKAKQIFDTQKLEHSYAGKMGKLLEPVIEPLGFDWKIGIALVTSFAAREVFVGTMNTIYSVGESEDSSHLLLERMRSEKRSGSEKPFFDLPTGLSLMLFYAFAMQCMSTMAVVKSETKSWKWPLLQFLWMGGLAWLSAWIAYQLFS
jgi:ferrous iron transport protein B